MASMELSDYINALNMTDPLKIIERYCRNKDNSLMKDVNKLYEEYVHVETGIINTLLLFILKLKDGYLPHYNYLSDSLMKWLNHIETTEQAVHLALRKKESPNAYRKPMHVQVKEPDWMDDYIADLKKMEG